MPLMNHCWYGCYYRDHSEMQQASAFRSLNQLSFQGIEHVLDVGCGPGTLSKWLADQVPQGKVLGVDASPSMIEQGLTDHQEVANLAFLCSKIEDLQLAEKFHLITSFNALHFVKDKERAFERIKALLYPKGKLLFRVALQRNPDFQAIFNAPRWKSFLEEREKKFFPLSVQRARSLLKRLGFTLLQCTTDLEPYFFSSPEKMTCWFIGWLTNLVAAGEDVLVEELASELTDHLCARARCQTNIPLRIFHTVVEATL